MGGRIKKALILTGCTSAVLFSSCACLCGGYFGVLWFTPPPDVEEAMIGEWGKEGETLDVFRFRYRHEFKKDGSFFREGGLFFNPPVHAQWRKLEKTGNTMKVEVFHDGGRLFTLEITVHGKNRICIEYPNGGSKHMYVRE